MLLIFQSAAKHVDTVFVTCDLMETSTSQWEFPGYGRMQLAWCSPCRSMLPFGESDAVADSWYTRGSPFSRCWIAVG